MDAEQRSCEKIIVCLADVWQYKLHEKSIYGLDDLISEGWEVYMLCKKSYDPKKGASFQTYLYFSVQTRFYRICTYDFREKRNGKEVSLLKPRKGPGSELKERNEIHKHFQTAKDLQDRQLMIAQVLAALSEVSADFASMITHEVPKELLSLAKRRMRAKKFRNNVKNPKSNIRFTKKMIENHFGVNLEKLKALVYNYL